MTYARLVSHSSPMRGSESSGGVLSSERPKRSSSGFNAARTRPRKKPVIASLIPSTIHPTMPPEPPSSSPSSGGCGSCGNSGWVGVGVGVAEGDGLDGGDAVGVSDGVGLGDGGDGGGRVSVGLGNASTGGPGACCADAPTATMRQPSRTPPMSVPTVSRQARRRPHAGRHFGPVLARAGMLRPPRCRVRSPRPAGPTPPSRIRARRS